jgi:hypothetical protein
MQQQPQPQSMPVQTLQSQPIYSDYHFFDDLLERSTNQQLDEMIADINDEKEMRKLRGHRLVKLRNTLKKRKEQIEIDLQRHKSKLLCDPDLDYSDELSDIEKPIKKPPRKNAAKKK